LIHDLASPSISSGVWRICRIVHGTLGQTGGENLLGSKQEARKMNPPSEIAGFSLNPKTAVDSFCVVDRGCLPHLHDAGTPHLSRDAHSSLSTTFMTAASQRGNAQEARPLGQPRRSLCSATCGKEKFRWKIDRLSSFPPSLASASGESPRASPGSRASCVVLWRASLRSSCAICSTGHF
jgi:hypothetical protein